MLKNVAFCLIYALPPDKQFFSHSDRLELQGKILNIVCVRGGGQGTYFGKQGNRQHLEWLHFYTQDLYLKVCGYKLIRNHKQISKEFQLFI